METNNFPDKEKNSRRQFLKYSLMAGTAVVAGATGIALATEEKSGETIKLLSPTGEVVEVDSSMINPSIPETVIENMQGAAPGRKFVMVIDLARCKNAGKCRTACTKMHGLEEGRSYIKVHKMQDSETTAPYWMPATCFHCDNPPCVKVCPVGATFKMSDGIVSIDNEKCVGCRFCMAACSYSARIFNWEEPKTQVAALGEGDHHCGTHKVGTVEKCDFCPQMTRKGELPKCVTACPNGVFYFGDENEDTVTNGDETVRLSKLLRDKAGYRFLEELGTKPRVYYLPPANRQFPFKDKTETES